MKKNLTILKNICTILILALILLGTGNRSFGQAVGDYGTRYTSGTYDWNTAANWIVCVTANSWTGATTATTVPSATKNVWIRSGSNYTISGSSSCSTLKIGNTTGASTTLTILGTNTLIVSGNVQMFRPATGGPGYNHTINVNAGTLTCGSLTMSATSSTTTRLNLVNISTGTMTINGTTSTGTTACRFVFSDIGTLDFHGTFTSTPTITAATGSTVIYSYTGSQTIAPTSYSNLTLSGSGAKTMTSISSITGNLTLNGTASATTAAALSIGGNLTVGSGTTFATGAYTLSVTGTTDVTGTLTLANTNAKTFTGDVIINSGGIWNETGAAAIGFAGSFTNNATTFTSSTGIHTFSGSSKTLSGSTVMAIPSATISGTYTNLGTLTSGTLLTVNGTLTNNGTLTASTALSGTGGVIQGTSGILNVGGTLGLTTLTATATGNTVNFTGSGSQTVPAFNYYNLTSSGSGTRTLASSGTIGIAGAFTKGSNTYTITGSTVSFNGTSSQTIPAFTFNNLTLDNTSGATLSSDATVNGILTFTNGKITTGSNSLILGNSATVSGAGAGKYVYGNLSKRIASSTTTKAFEVGDASVYAPLTLDFTGTTNGTGTITASTTATSHPNIGSSTVNTALNLNRYWALANNGVSGFSTYNATFTFDSGDLDAGADYSSFILGQYSSSAWTYPEVGTTTATSLQATGLSTFGDFQFGESSIAPAACSYSDNGTTPTVANIMPCLNFTSNPLTVSTTFTAHQYFTMNVIKGLTYQVYTGNTTSPSSPLKISVYKEGAPSDVCLAFSYSNAGNPLTSVANNVYVSFTPSFSGQVRVLINKKTSCSSTTPSGLTVLVNVSGGSNTQDTQTAAGTNTWIGHVYDGTNSAILFDGNFANYLGNYTQTETFNETFGDAGNDTYCFPINSDGANRANLLTVTYAVRYRMSSTKRGLWIADIGSDDGSRLAVDGSLIYNNWSDQSYGSKTGVLMNLTGSSSLVLDFYENGGGNQISFLNLTQVLGNNLTENTTQNICLGSSGSAIAGDTYGTLPTGISLSGTGYQWTYSTTPDGARTNISGATGATFTPNTTVAPFNTAGTYYIYRNAILSSANNVSPTTYVATNESNVATITVNSLPAAPTVGTITQPTCAVAGSVVLSGLPSSGTWTLTRTPGGTTTTGSGTSTTLSGISGGTYTYTVTSATGCISLASNNVVINTQPTVPSAAGTITGTASVYKGITGYSYTIDAISNATSYGWSYSGTGVTINGTGNTISIDFSSTATSGNLTVYGINACGNGTVSASYAITVLTAPTPLWYKADAGTSSTTDGGAVSTWNDQAGTNHATSQLTAPTYQSLGFNFNPAINFSAGYYLNTANPVIDDMTFFAVYSSSQSVTSGNFWQTPAIIGGETSGATNDYTLSTNAGKLYFKGTSGDNFGAQTTGTYNDGVAKVIAVTRQKSATGNIYLYVNGTQAATASSDNNSLSGPTKLGIGNHPAYQSSAQFVGFISEIYGVPSVYSTNLRNRVESYLALKYGVTLGSTSGSVDYLAGSGNTVWTGSSTYQNDIAGLGKDATYGLDQKVSASANTISGVSSRVVMATTNDFTSSNLSGSRTSLAAGQYLIWGHNGGATTAWSEDGKYDRVARSWRVQNTGSVGQVYLQLDLGSYPTLPTGRTLKLLVDGDGTLSGGETTEYTLTNTSGTLYTASVTFPSGTSYFTVGYEALVPTVILSVSPSAIAEDGGVATFTATLNALTSRTVTVNLAFTGTATSGTDYTIGSSTITIAAGNTSGTTTVTGVNDYFQDAAETIIADISTVTNGTENGTQQATVTITDDDSPGVTVTPTSGLTTTEALGTATFTVKLNTQPTSSVTIALSSSDTTEGTVSPGSLTFTTSNWNTAQTVTITGVDDATIDGDITYSIVTGAAVSTDATYNGMAVPDVSVINYDNDGAAIGSIAVDRTAPQNTYTPAELVQNVLVQGCLKASNVKFNNGTAKTQQIGYFAKGSSSFPISEGIILSTGNVADAEGPNYDYNTTTQVGSAGDSDINTITGGTSSDAAVLEFDFVPAGNTIEFNYVFASEEYAEYVGQNYNDAFAFLLSGPGITGTTNIALIPGTTTPVSINTVHGQGATLVSGYPSGLQNKLTYKTSWGHSYSGGTYGPWTISPTNNSSQPPLNSSYYVDNGHFTNRTDGTLTWTNGNGGAEMEFDGRTTVLTASHAVTACQTYHIKIVVADVTDNKWDSGVFLQGRSFTSNEVQISSQINGITGDASDMYEGCEGSYIRFQRVAGADNSIPLSFPILLSGTATNGVDFVYTDSAGNVIGDGTFPTTATLPAGVNYVDYYYKAQSDGAVEGNETIVFRVNNGCPCDTEPTYYTKTVTIKDTPQVPTSTVSVVFCNNGQNPLATITVVLPDGLDASNYLFAIVPSGSSDPAFSSYQTSNQFQIVSTTADGSDIVGDLYDIFVSDKYGCQTRAVRNVVIPELSPFGVNAGSDVSMCQGQSGIQLNGSGSILYTWTCSPASGTSYLSSTTVANPTVSSSIPVGTYTFTLTGQDVAGSTPTCSGTDVVVLTVKQKPTVSAAASVSSTCNASSVQLSSTVTNGGAAPTYSWNPSANLNNSTIANPVYTPSVAAYTVQAFSVTVTADNGCSATATTSDVLVYPSPVITTGTVVNATCGGNNGSATVSASSSGVNPIPSYTYAWNSAAGSQTTATASNLAAGTYTVTVTDATHECPSSKTVTVGTTADTTPPTVVCQNITVTLVGGTASITPAQVNNGSSDNCTPAGSLTFSLDKTTFGYSDVGSKTVTLTVTDASGNSATCTSVVTVNNPTTCSLSGTSDIYWETFGDGTPVNTGYTLGTNYSISSNKVQVTNNQSTANFYLSKSIDISSYTNLNIMVDRPATSGSLNSSDYIDVLYSLNGGAFTRFANNGHVTGNYSTAQSSCTNVPNGNTVQIKIIGYNNASEYYYFDNVHLKGDPALQIATTITNVSCNGLSNGQIVAEGSGAPTPYSYKLNVAPYTNYQSSGTFVGLPAGTYIVTAKDNNGVENTKSVTITQPAVDIALTQKSLSDATICSPAPSNVTFTVGSSQSGVVYELKTTGGASLSPAVKATGTGSDLTLTLLQANVPAVTTTYKVVATSASGCTSLDMTDQPTLTVYNTAAPTGSTTQSFCSSNSPKISNISVSGSNIKWYNASSGGTVLPSTTTLVNGTTYYASQTLNGCESASRLAVTVTVTSTPQIVTITKGYICGSGTTTLYATSSAGSTINWYSASSGGSSLGTGSSFLTPSLSATTSYWADATLNGCSSLSRDQIDAEVHEIPSVTLGSSPVACNGATSATLTYSAAVGNPNRYSINFDGTAEGVGFVDVSDATLSASPITITVPGTAAAGVYGATLSLKNSSYGCVSTNYPITVTLSANAAITGQPTAPSSVCASSGVATMTVAASGNGLTYQWYVDGTTALTETAPYSGVTTSTLTITNPSSGLNGKQYTVKVQGACGPQLTSNAVALTVSSTAAPTGSSGQSFCSGSTPTVANLAATGTAIKWYAAATGGTALASTTALVNGTHYYATQTINGCESISRFDVTATVNNSPSTSLTVSDAAICKPATGNVTITISNAANGVTYELKTTDGTSFTPAIAGTGSGANLNLVIPQASLPTVTTNYKVVASIAGCSSVDLTDQATVVVDSEKPVFSNCPSNMTVNVDAGLCSKVVDWTIPTVSDNCSTPTVTVVSSVGEIITTPVAGTNRATITTGTSIITYTATDSNGNTQTCSFTITVVDNIKPTITCPAGQTVFCVSNAPTYTTYAEFTAAGGSASDNCSLNISSFTKLEDNLVGSTLTRTYQIADMAGNVSTCQQVFSLSQPAITISSLNTDNTCIGGSLSISTTNTGYNYQWQVSSNNGSTWTNVGTNSPSFTGSLAHQGDQYRLLVSQTALFSDENCTLVSNALTFRENTPPVFTAYAPVSQTLCAAFGSTTAAVSGISLTNLKATDNCTAFADLQLAYVLTGATTGSGTNLTDGALFNIGTTHIVYTITDQAGLSKTLSIDVVVNASPAPITISHSVVSGGGTGVSPKQCGDYRYYVTEDASAPESGYTYSWKVYAGSGTTGTQLTSGTDYQIDNSASPYHSASVKISWPGSLVNGTYTIEVIKGASNGCDSRATLEISLQNSFNLYVNDPGHDCKGESLGSKIIDWQIGRNCGTSTYSFKYVIAAGNYTTLSEAQAHAISGMPVTVSSTSDNPKIIYQTVDYGSGGDFYTTQVFTLFIYDQTDGNGQPDTNAADNYQHFFLNGIPNTSEISTD